METPSVEDLLKEFSDGRTHATIAAHTIAILGGASIVRVHDVRPAVEAAAVADAILSAKK